MCWAYHEAKRTKEPGIPKQTGGGVDILGADTRPSRKPGICNETTRPSKDAKQNLIHNLRHQDNGLDGVALYAAVQDELANLMPSRVVHEEIDQCTVLHRPLLIV